MEAGHRCAIPACRQVPVEIAHIVPWEKVNEHTFDNLIALCATCHTRYDAGQIDRMAMLQYKANLSILNGRYGDLEQRVLRAFAADPGMSEISLPGGLDILLMYLLGDGLLVDTGRTSGLWLNDLPSEKVYQITEKGRKFVQRWLAAQELE